MTKTLRAGVMGTGVFGGYHARKYVENPDVELVAVYDILKELAEKRAAEFECDAYTDLDAFLNAVDVITIASPAQTHFDNARAAIKAGKSVLIEKPISQTFEQGQKLCALAEASDVTLAIGHQERLVFQEIGLLSLNETPTLIEASRVGAWSGRAADVSVTLDLMIHDIDLVLSLLGHPKWLDIKANAERVHTPFADHIDVDITFETGARVKLVAGRTAEDRDRKMRLVYPSGEVKIDFVERSFESTLPFKLNPNFSETKTGSDPLAANVAAFIDTVLGRRNRPAVTGAEGLTALDLTLAVDAAAEFKA